MGNKNKITPKNKSAYPRKNFPIFLTTTYTVVAAFTVVTIIFIGAVVDNHSVSQ